MISSLRGSVLRVEEEWVVLEVGGVGYQVFVHPRTGAALLTSKGEVSLVVHTVVREDAITLYGFESLEELACFRHLLSVERIGPKAALAILARTEWPSLVAAIMAEDHALLAATPGVGAKTAQRIVLELKGRVDSLALVGSRPLATRPGELGDRVAQALVGLGFSLGDARGVVAAELAVGATGPDRTLEDVVAACLRRLGPAGRLSA